MQHSSNPRSKRALELGVEAFWRQDLMIIMRITSNRLRTFTNTELTLDNNYNLIVGSNEYSKTTLFAFI